MKLFSNNEQKWCQCRVVVSGGVVSGVIHVAVGDDEFWDWTSVHQSVYIDLQVSKG